MLRLTKYSFILVSFLIVFNVVSSTSVFSSSPKVWERQFITNKEKTWLIEFSMPVNEKKFSRKSIFIEDSKNRKKAVTFSFMDDNMAVRVAPKTPYQEGEQYYLHVTQAIQSSSGKDLAETVIVPFIYEKEKRPEPKPPVEIKVKQHSYVIEITAKATDHVSKIKLNGKDMHYIGNNTYELAFSDKSMKEVTVRAYNAERKSIYRETIAIK